MVLAVRVHGDEHVVSLARGVKQRGLDRATVARLQRWRAVATPCSARMLCVASREPSLTTSRSCSGKAPRMRPIKPAMVAASLKAGTAIRTRVALMSDGGTAALRSPFGAEYSTRVRPARGDVVALPALTVGRPRTNIPAPCSYRTTHSLIVSSASPGSRSHFSVVFSCGGGHDRHMVWRWSWGSSSSHGPPTGSHWSARTLAR